jgi:uncharacterized protein (TIRG00374 family)
LKKPLFKFIQFAITFALLALVAYQAGLFSAQGRAVFWDTFKNADLILLVYAVLFGVVVNLISAFKWYLLTRSQNLGAGYWRIFVYYVVGQFYNMFLPTSVGGDVVRSYQLGKYSGRQADALASVFVERYTGVLTLLLTAAMAVLTQFARLNQTLVFVCLFLFAVGLSLIAWFVFDPRPYQWCRSFIVTKVNRLESLFTKIDKLVLSIEVYRHKPAVLLMAFVNSLAFYIAAVVNVYLCAIAFSPEVLFIDVLVVTPIIMLIMNIPFSFGNIGFMELGYSSMFALMGYAPELGLSIAILMRFKSLFDALIGGVLRPIFVTHKPE